MCGSFVLGSFSLGAYFIVLCEFGAYLKGLWMNEPAHGFFGWNKNDICFAMRAKNDIPDRAGKTKVFIGSAKVVIKVMLV